MAPVYSGHPWDLKVPVIEGALCTFVELYAIIEPILYCAGDLAAIERGSHRLGLGWRGGILTQ